jgi:hypothetical protein
MASDDIECHDEAKRCERGQGNANNRGKMLSCHVSPSVFSVTGKAGPYEENEDCNIEGNRTETRR